MSVAGALERKKYKGSLQQKSKGTDVRFLIKLVPPFFGRQRHQPRLLGVQRSFFALSATEAAQRSSSGDISSGRFAFVLVPFRRRRLSFSSLLGRSITPRIHRSFPSSDIPRSFPFVPEREIPRTDRDTQ